MTTTSSSIRRPFTALLSVLCLATFASCGGDDDTATTAPPESSAAPSEYPLTVEHANGTTVIERRPERIVTVGITDETVLLAFGVKAVGYAGWWGEDKDLSWPWSADLWGDDLPQRVSSDSFEIDLEDVAALEPDLILGLWASADANMYDLYSAIAPTVIMGTPDQQNVDWRESTRLVGRILGESAEADTFITDLDAKFAAVAAAHPDYAATTAAFVSPEVDGSLWAYSPLDGRGQFLTGVGFAVDEHLTDAFPEGRATLQVANERFDVFDGVGCLFVSVASADVEAALAANELYQSIPAVRNGCALELLNFGDGPPIVEALSTNNVLSLEYAIDNVVVLLDAVAVPSSSSLVDGIDASLAVLGDARAEATLRRMYRDEQRRYETNGADLQRWDDGERDPAAWEHYAFPVRPEQGALLYLLTRAGRVERVVEFATSFGFSTIFVAAAVRDNGGGQVITAELVSSKADAARRNLAEAGLEDLVDIRIGDATQQLSELPGPVDMFIIDGWPSGQTPSVDRRVLDLVLPHLRPGAIVFDDNGEPDCVDRLTTTGDFRSLSLPLADGGHLAIYDPQAASSR